MDQPNPTGARPRLHPLVATAAVAVIVLSAVGVTALVMNRSNAQPSPYDAPAVASNAAVPAPQPAQPNGNASPYAAPAPVPSASVPSTTNESVTQARVAQIQAPTQAPQAQPPAAQAAPVACRDCGVVDSIREIKVKGQGTGVGAVGGAVVGGLLGNMVGAGRGKALATVGGAVAGGFGGNAIEKNVRADVEHQMIVRLDNGGTRTFTQAAPFGYREGERVRVVNGHVERA